MFWLFTSTVPRVGRSMSAINRSNVLLPAPDGPVMNANSPRSRLNETPSAPRGPSGSACGRSRNESRRALADQRAHELPRTEHLEIVDALAERDEANRHA